MDQLRLTLKNAVGRPDELIQATYKVKDPVAEGESVVRRHTDTGTITSDFAGDYKALCAKAKQVFGRTNRIEFPAQAVTDDHGVQRQEVVIDFGARPSI